jgi:hypothetical protein
MKGNIQKTPISVTPGRAGDHQHKKIERLERDRPMIVSYTPIVVERIEDVWDEHSRKVAGFYVTGDVG